MMQIAMSIYVLADWRRVEIRDFCRVSCCVLIPNVVVDFVTRQRQEKNYHLLSRFGDSFGFYCRCQLLHCGSSKSGGIRLGIRKDQDGRYTPRFSRYGQIDPIGWLSCPFHISCIYMFHPLQTICSVLENEPTLPANLTKLWKISTSCWRNIPTTRYM
jgi:hypothetical protein